MAEGMFGAPVGISQLGEDSRKDALASMSILESAGKLQMQPFEIAAKQAGTRLHNATAEEKEMEAQMQRALMSRMSQRAPGGPTEDPTTLVDQLGIDALATGNFKLGREFINTGSLLRSREATAEFRAAQVVEIEQRALLNKLKRSNEIAGAVRENDQAGYDQALMQMTESGIDVRGYPKDVQSGFPVMRRMAESSMTEYQRARLEQQELTNFLAEKRESRMEGGEQARRPLVQAQTALAEARRARIERDQGAGGTVGSASREDRKEVIGLLKDSKIDLPDEEMVLAARGIASRAKALVKQRRGLDFSQAARIALKEAQDAGDFPETGTWNPLAKAHKYAGGGKTPETSIAIPTSGTDPKTGKPKADASKMVIGRYYTAPDGRTVKWTARGAELVTPMLPRVGGAAATEADEDEEDE